MKSGSGEPIKLGTGNYILRSLEESDATQRYLNWLKDPEVVRYLNAQHATPSIDGIQHYIRRHDNVTSFHVGIFSLPEENHVGNFSFYLDIPSEVVNINVLVGEREFWGKQVVTETRAAILDFLFDDLGAHKVWGSPWANNHAAIFNYKKQGFNMEAILRDHKRDASGDRIAVIHFSILKEEWTGRRSG